MEELRSPALTATSAIQDAGAGMPLAGTASTLRMQPPLLCAIQERMHAALHDSACDYLIL